MRIVEGDLVALALDGHFDVIIHGCNCQCVMGKGIALAIRQNFPEAYHADTDTLVGASKLGTFSFADIKREKASFSVVNAYTQDHFRGPGVKADYHAIRNVFKLIRNQFHGQRIGYCKLGAGLAGGDWKVISSIIDEELGGENHTCVVLPG